MSLFSDFFSGLLNGSSRSTGRGRQYNNNPADYRAATDAQTLVNATAKGDVVNELLMQRALSQVLPCVAVSGCTIVDDQYSTTMTLNDDIRVQTSNNTNLIAINSVPITVTPGVSNYDITLSAVYTPNMRLSNSEYAVIDSKNVTRPIFTINALLFTVTPNINTTVGTYKVAIQYVNSWGSLATDGTGVQTDYIVNRSLTVTNTSGVQGHSFVVNYVTPTPSISFSESGVLQASDTNTAYVQPFKMVSEVGGGSTVTSSQIKIQINGINMTSPASVTLAPLVNSLYTGDSFLAGQISNYRIS